jgi:broad-specificity NMP kinase
MNRILITGMSGTGKSSVIRELAGRGYPAVDLDTSEWSEWVDTPDTDPLTPAEGQDWIWRLDRVGALLTRYENETLFISGCAENMHVLYPLIDTIILLSAPTARITERLEARATDGYGHTADEREKVLELIAIIEPLLREAADHEIDTSGPIPATVDAILCLSYPSSTG